MLLTRLHLFAAAIAATVALVAPASSSAATVVNGEFETGNLDGWTVFNRSGGPSTEDSWYAYTGIVPPGPSELNVTPPPNGNYAAVTSQGGEGLHILYQDVPLEPYYTHQLVLMAYYRSDAPLTTPSPDGFGFEGDANQQYRIDVMNPAAPPDSVNPADVLASVFATKTGDSQELKPTLLTADLTPFAGQTVRLRFAEVDNRGYLAASADVVTIQSSAPSNLIALGKPSLNKKKGTARLPVSVPGPGTLVIADVKNSKRRIKAKTLTAIAAGTLKLPIKTTKSARKTLAEKGKLKLKVAVAFTPTGGFAASVTRQLTLKLVPK
ncbi:MAG TPA: hypothetical protein VKB23_08480 [Solirubrobacterales bacterium]|nr:hypothetical protein [Solirubrobacterales bacterium]